MTPVIKCPQCTSTQVEPVACSFARDKNPAGIWHCKNCDKYFTPKKFINLK